VESLGEKLKTAREARGLDFDQVSRETNIAVRYLQAFENEFFDGFPGEPYLIGFLRTYGAYLELDVQELLSLYRSLKIQEQPVPQQLLKDPSPLPKIALTAAIILAVLGVGGGGIFFLVTRPRKSAVQPPAPRSSLEYTMNSDTFERRFYPGDTLLIPLEENQYKLELGNLDDRAAVRTPFGIERLDLGQSVNLDLNKNGINDVQITAADFVKHSPEKGVLLRIEMTGSPAEFPVDVPAVQADSAAGLIASTVIFSSSNAYPFTLQSNFQGYCMFRWEILFERDRRDRNERYFQRSDELNIQAQNGIRIWASNAQAAKFQVIGGGRTVPVELGGAGEVVVADIRWVRDEDNRYRLILIRLETGNA
jgi:cytoskeletal protein RodZ